jgi:hypothetical protein
VSQDSNEAAFRTCEAIAREQALATGEGEYADGYRSAAERIAASIRARRGGEDVTPLERDLRDVEMEARAFARFLEVVRNRIEVEGGGDGTAALRSLLSELLGADAPREETPSEPPMLVICAPRRPLQ